VGEVHGHLLAPDASVADDASVMTDAAMPEDAPPTLDAGAPAAEGSVDAAPGCAADLDADPGNCGWCGHACGGPCSAGACKEQFIWNVTPSGMAYDQGSLFFSGAMNGEVVAWNLGTAMPTTIAPAQNAAGHIVAHSPYVFWTTGDGAVHRVLEDGGALTTIVPAASATCLAANSSRLYWWNPNSGTARSVPVDSDGGATPAIEYTATPGAAGCVVADDSELAVLTSGALIQRDLDSGLATTAALPYPAATQFVALAGERAVAITTSTDDAGSTGHVDVVPKGTSTALEVASFPWSTVFALVADDAGIYWSPQGEARVDGCSDVLCTSGIRHYTPTETNFTISKLALDPTYIYFTMGGATGTLDRVPR
jgi:hypothetical protein